MEAILGAIGSPLIVLVLVAFVYWSTSWIKRVLKDKLNEVFVQPIALVVGTLLAGFILFNYNFRPVDLGISKYLVVDYLLQGALLAALAGTLYDKYLKKK